VDDGQLHELAERFDVEGHLRALLRGDALAGLLGQLEGFGELGREGVPGVGEPPVRIGLEHDLLGIGDRHAEQIPAHGRAGLPVGLKRGAPEVALGEGRVGERLPESFGRRSDVGRVDERRLVHAGVLQCSFQVGERVDAVALVGRDPALADLVDGCRVQEVELLPPAANGGDEIGRLEDGEVLADRLPGHVEPGAELAQGLSVADVQAVEQLPATRVGKRLEHLVHPRIRSHLAT
jgi:hypothetical protein